MQAEDRLIHFSTELIHPPTKHDRAALQGLYFELSQTRAAYDSIDTDRPGFGKFHSKRGKRTQSIALFLPDRLTFIEEWSDIALATFLDKVRDMVPRAMATLKVPFFVAQTVTLRSTFGLTHYEDARVFLLERVCGQADRIAPHFGRPLAAGGLRFVLPETPDHPGTLHVVIESFRENLDEVFVEVKGIFGQTRINAGSVERLIDHVQVVRTFISDAVFPYLNQYDAPEEDYV